MTQRIFLKAYCNQSRYEAIGALEDIISEHAYIVEFMPFSDIALSLIIEVSGKNLKALMNDLEKYTHLPELQISPEQDREYQLMLHVTFINGMGNLKHEVPNVPG